MDGVQCVMLSLTSKMQRLCVESWTVGLLYRLLGAAAFGKGDAQMWTQEIQCRGNESHIRHCPSSTSHNMNCTHDNDVGLICSGKIFKQTQLLNLLKFNDHIKQS